MRPLVLLSTLVMLAYPLAIYFGLSRWGIGGVAGFLGVLFILRIAGGSSAKFKQFKVVAWISGGIGLVLVLLSTLLREAGWFLYYPIAVSLLMLTLFGSSLWQEQSLIEYFARIREPELPVEGISYCRSVTKVWCGFFLINATIALITTFLSLEVWTLYNGFISYLIMGSLFIGEFLIRGRMYRKVEDA